ncbi:hypothetical protein C8R47DRAFT_1079878 [Mycena vitilis]|nr:hypothetical protein C8R47DRAFT_1079878 [Mycena vitilis]
MGAAVGNSAAATILWLSRTPDVNDPKNLSLDSGEGRQRRETRTRTHSEVTGTPSDVPGSGSFLGNAARNIVTGSKNSHYTEGEKESYGLLSPPFAADRIFVSRYWSMVPFKTSTSRAAMQQRNPSASVVIQLRSRRNRPVWYLRNNNGQPGRKRITGLGQPRVADTTRSWQSREDDRVKGTQVHSRLKSALPWPVGPAPLVCLHCNGDRKRDHQRDHERDHQREQRNNDRHLLQQHPRLRDLQTLQLLDFLRLAALLKQDIGLAQPARQDPDTAPAHLPESVATFLANATGIASDDVVCLWGVMKEEVWTMEPGDSNAVTAHRRVAV